MEIVLVITVLLLPIVAVTLGWFWLGAHRDSVQTKIELAAAKRNNDDFDRLRHRALHFGLAFSDCGKDHNRGQHRAQSRKDYEHYRSSHRCPLLARPAVAGWPPRAEFNRSHIRPQLPDLRGGGCPRRLFRVPGFQVRGVEG